MALQFQFNIQTTGQLGNVKRQKVEKFLSKPNKKRVVTFSGLIAKLQQSLLNGEDQFVYFASKQVVAFLTLLREAGVVHNFHRLTKNVVGGYLSPAFDDRMLVVYLKNISKHGAALSGFKMFTVPSRSMTLSYRQLLEQSQATGPATLYVLNTRQGLLTHIVALQRKIGGEVVCAIK